MKQIVRFILSRFDFFEKRGLEYLCLLNNLLTNFLKKFV